MPAFLNFDLGIVFAYFALVLWLGLTAGKKVTSLAEFATGGKNYSSFFVFTTLSAAFIGGGFTTGLAEKVFSLGLVYVVGLWGFSLKEILVATLIAPKMAQFSSAIPVGDIMGQLYGKPAKVLTGLASVLVCAGIAGAQFSAFGYVLNVLTSFPHQWGILLGAVIVITYSSLGGMKAVVVNDTLHFCILIVMLPLTCWMAYGYVGGWETIQATVPVGHLYWWGEVPYWAVAVLFLNFFLGETLVPPYVQRLLIGKRLQDVVKGTLWSGLMSIPFFLCIGLFGLMAYTIDPQLSADLALPAVINTVLPVGLKGLAIAAMMAVVMSSADSFLNAAGVALMNDVFKPLWTGKASAMEGLSALSWSRYLTFIVGVLGAVFAVSTESVIQILLNAYNFWTPFILVPLVLGIVGYVVSPRVFWWASALGISSTLCWEYHLLGSDPSPYDLNGAIVGVGVNAVVIFLSAALRWQKKMAEQVSL